MGNAPELVAKSRNVPVYSISDRDLYHIETPGRISHLITSGGRESLNTILSNGLSTQHNNYSESHRLRELSPSLHVTMGDRNTGLYCPDSNKHPVHFSLFSKGREEEAYGLLFSTKLNEEILKFMKRVGSFNKLEEQQRNLGLWNQVVAGEDIKKDDYQELANFMRFFYDIHISELEEKLRDAPEEARKGLIRGAISNLFHAQWVLAQLDTVYSGDKAVRYNRIMNNFPFSSHNDDGLFFRNFGIRPMVISEEKPHQLRGLTIPPEYIQFVLIKEGNNIRLVDPKKL